MLAVQARTKTPTTVSPNYRFGVCGGTVSQIFQLMYVSTLGLSLKGLFLALYSIYGV